MRVKDKQWRGTALFCSTDTQKNKKNRLTLALCKMMRCVIWNTSRYTRVVGWLEYFLNGCSWWPLLLLTRGLSQLNCSLLLNANKQYSLCCLDYVFCHCHLLKWLMCFSILFCMHDTPEDLNTCCMWGLSNTLNNYAHTDEITDGNTHSSSQVMRWTFLNRQITQFKTFSRSRFPNLILLVSSGYKTLREKYQRKSKYDYFYFYIFNKPNFIFSTISIHHWSPLLFLTCQTGGLASFLFF